MPYYWKPATKTNVCILIQRESISQQYGLVIGRIGPKTNDYLVQRVSEF